MVFLAQRLSRDLQTMVHSILVFLFAFLLKKIVDLPLFTRWPDPRLYSSGIVAIRSVPLLEALVKIRQSSANRRCETQGACLLTHSPLDTYKGPILLSILDKPSEHSRNKYGEIGSPWCIPLDGVKLSKNTPFSLIEKDTDEIHFMTNEHHVSGKPNALIIASRYLHSTRSYAFAMSGLIAQSPVLAFFCLR